MPKLFFVFLLDCQLTVKEHHSGTARWEMRGARGGAGVRDFDAILSMPFPCISECPPTGSSQDPSVGCRGGFPTQAGLVKSLAGGG